MAPAFFLITTASATSARCGPLDRLLSSVLTTPSVSVACVARGWPSALVRAYDATYGERVALIHADEGTSLSAARNIALTYLRDADIQTGIAAFPDDDCWYFDDTLTTVAEAFAERPELSMVVGSYAPSARSVDTRRFPSGEADLSPRRAAMVVASVTMFVRVEHLQTIGEFNVSLGAGTRFLAGEDTDYVLRALELGLSVAYRPNVIIGHSYGERPDLSYAGPFLLVLAHHLRRSPSLAPLFVRAAAGSVRRRPKGSGPLHAFRYLHPEAIRRVRADERLRAVENSDRNASAIWSIRRRWRQHPTRRSAGRQWESRR